MLLKQRILQMFINSLTGVRFVSSTSEASNTKMNSRGLSLFNGINSGSNVDSRCNGMAEIMNLIRIHSLRASLRSEERLNHLKLKE